ncbi:hypothetical protein E2C01_059735 [Portunus trituberculatus]|uniref:Uncharacterized protein n=1 Tax=Portunus trituberculatus TaxID=210409 RepID=A0A5B7H8L8_PORTR|nr:hypothetical protein [Portunus trituberculatus]
METYPGEEEAPVTHHLPTITLDEASGVKLYRGWVYVSHLPDTCERKESRVSSIMGVYWLLS